MGGHGSGTSPNSLKNLTSPAKGRPGTANSRAILLSKAYKAKLAELDVEKNPDKTFAEVIAQEMVLLAARNKSIKAATEIADRVEGRPQQNLNLDVPQSAEERIASIFQFLSILKGTDDRAESSTDRVM
jgi:hypothetical protein